MSLIDTWAFLQLLKEDMKPYPGEKRQEQPPLPAPVPQPVEPETTELFSVKRVSVFLLKFFGVIIAAWVVIYLIDCYGFLSFLGIVASLGIGFVALCFLVSAMVVR